jgi:hypothetical protein
MDEIMDNGVDTTSASKGMHTCAYMPPDGTPIYEYLEGIKRKVKRGFINVQTGPMFIPPSRDPVSQGIGIDGTPNSFYVGDVWVHIWLVK